MTIYQIDYSAASSGKKVSMTKRRLRWRWGLANKKAVSEGKVGVECRGYEHEVTLVWSITSGKRLIIDDGNEIHFSIGRRAEGKFQHSWKGSGGSVFTIVAYASPPLNSKQRGFKQFDFLIDGRSFDTFARIYELGLRNDSVRNASYPSDAGKATAYLGSPGVPTSVYYGRESPSSYADYRSDRESLRPSQDEEMQWARRMHALESQRSMNERHVQTQPQAESSADAQDLLSSPTESLLDMQIPSHSSSTESASHWDLKDDEFSPYNNPSQPPSYEAVWSSIMDAYDTNTQPNAVSTTITTSTTVTTATSDKKMPDISNLEIRTDYSSKKFSSMESPRDVTDIDGVFKNLVNLDDISSNGTTYKYSKEKYDQEQREKSRTKTLYELKSSNATQSTATTSQKEIMKTHQPVATANPGAVVVYGQPQQQGYNNYAYSAPVMYSAY